MQIWDMPRALHHVKFVDGGSPLSDDPDYDPKDPKANEAVPVLFFDEANIISSIHRDDLGKKTDRRHYPVIDIDVPAMLVPSTTEGHSHLYINMEVPEESYFKLLEVLVECGIVEPGYSGASKKRGFGSVRIPGHKKEKT